MLTFFIRRPRFAMVIALLMTFVGAVSLKLIPVEQYPQITPPVINVSASWPGASAADVAEAIAAPLETQINGVDHMLYMESTSSDEGTYSLSLTFAAGTDADLAAIDVQNRVSQAVAQLPADVQQNGVQVRKRATNLLMGVSLYSPLGTLSPLFVSNYASTQVREALARLPGVGEVQMFGARDYSMRIWLRPDRMNALNITTDDIAQALREQNVQGAAGQVGTPPVFNGQLQTLTINGIGRLSDAAGFGQIVVRSGERGQLVRLSDVATIELGARSYSSGAQLNGKDSAYLGIYPTPTANALQVATAVRAELTRLHARFPADLTWEVKFDTTRFVAATIKEIGVSLALTLMAVVVVVSLFLQSWRATLIVALAIPVSLIGTFAVLYALGYSANTLSLFAIILALTMVVDDAIVVVENVERVIAEDKLPPKEATHKSMGQIQRALVGIAVVLSAVFMPMAFMSGATGEIYRQFSITLISSMLLSVFVAMSLTPALCATILKAAPEGGHKPNALFARFNTLFEKSTQHYTDSTRSLLRCTGRYMVVYLLICAGMAVLFLRTPTSFLPEEDQGVFMTTAQLPSGATMVNTTKVLQQVTDYYLTKEKNNVQSVFTVGGFGFSGQGQNNGLAFISLKPWSERVGEENSVTAIIQRAMIALSSINKAVVFPFNLPAVAELGTASGFDMELLDNGNLGHEKLTQARNELLSLAAQSPNQVIGVRPNGLEDTPMFKVNVNAAKAEAMGVALSDINQTISTAFGSSYVNDFLNQGRVKKVYVQAGTPFRMLPDNINQWYVRNASGTMAPLSAYSSTEWTYGSPRLERYNGIPSMEILGEAAAGKSTGDAMKFMADLVAKLPAGVGYSWTGLSYQEALSSNQAPALYAISLVVVFLALAALYESWSIPFSVMLVVPLGVVGALLATDLRGLSNDVYFQVGLLTTIGLSAKNAILIVEFAVEMMQKEGKTPVEAIIEAARMRLRPILMTSLAFILGVLPLVISHGAGSGAQNAVGTGVMGGMFAATVLAIYFVPVFFVVVEHLFARFKKA